MSNLLVIQGGGPTAVVNATLWAVIDEALRSRFGRILGARFGMEGLIKGNFVDLAGISPDDFQKLRMTPGAWLGSSRQKSEAADLERILRRLAEQDVQALIVIGGNGSLRGAQAISDAARHAGYELCVIGAPKTIDNDIPGTDRCPGYGSAARYVAQSVRDLSMDVRSLPQPVSIFETMGRGAGWLAGASVLAKRDQNDAPQLVYLPEKPFDMERFLGDVDDVVRRLGWAVVVVSDGIRKADATPVFERSADTQRDAMKRALAGDVAAHLADVVTQRLKIRCRSEKPGLCGRASILHVSRQDLADAEMVGRAAVHAAMEGGQAQMVALRPIDTGSSELVPLSGVAGDRVMPEEYLADGPSAVGEKFLQYVRPLVGELLEYA